MRTLFGAVAAIIILTGGAHAQDAERVRQAQLCYSAALMQPTRTGSYGESVANATRAYYECLNGRPMPATQAPAQSGLTCMSAGEEEAGMNKICYYDCGGSRAAMTVSATDLCPLTMQR